MRTTLTLDDDVAAKLQQASRRTGRSFRDVVNETLRRGLQQKSTTVRTPFRVHTRDMGALAPGLQLDNVADLIESVEGPLAR
ncbi:MAG: type II toxin-antitoxin system VapB family antitoxin [Pseudomonadota bacterium]|nr:type II toxin-antitoxin system VapB family antitoxin [Pseudomonadota bacterium]HWL63341.1 hypothetical protein [Steroidobacteraceae bacterium]